MYDIKRIYNQEPAVLVGIVEAILAIFLYFVDADPALIALILGALTLILNTIYVRPKTTTKDSLERRGISY